MPENKRPEEEKVKVEVSKPAKPQPVSEKSKTKAPAPEALVVVAPKPEPKVTKPQAEIRAQEEKPELGPETKKPSKKGTKWLEVHLRSFLTFLKFIIRPKPM